jgi:hypothetical protein
MLNEDSQYVRELLRQVEYPGFSRDIVAAGFVGNVIAVDSLVEIEFKPDTTDEKKIETMERHIRKLLQQAKYSDIVIRRAAPYVHDIPLRSAEDLANELKNTATGPGLPNRLMTPLQAEFLEDGELPEADLLAVALGRPNIATGAGYGPGGPQPLAGPREQISFDAGIPVLQWDIDPHDPNAQTRHNEIKLGDWDYRVWWQAHPQDELLYVSMQALKEDWVDHDNNAVPHPIGRSEAVNLVFDIHRHAVVAIYGTVRDFRPFVKAFSLAFEKEESNPAEPANEEANES